MSFSKTSAGYMTNVAARLFARAVDAGLSDLGVRAGYLPIYFALASGERTQAELARIAALEQPTVAATLNRMERDGLIARKPDPKDGRIALISLTEMAKSKVKRVERAVTQVNQRAAADLTDAEFTAFMTTLDKIVLALGERQGQQPQ